MALCRNGLPVGSQGALTSPEAARLANVVQPQDSVTSLGSHKTGNPHSCQGSVTGGIKGSRTPAWRRHPL